MYFVIPNLGKKKPTECGLKKGGYNGNKANKREWTPLFSHVSNIYFSSWECQFSSS